MRAGHLQIKMHSGTGGNRRYPAVELRAEINEREDIPYPNGAKRDIIQRIETAPGVM